MSEQVVCVVIICSVSIGGHYISLFKSFGRVCCFVDGDDASMVVVETAAVMVAAVAMVVMVVMAATAVVVVATVAL